MPGRPRASVPTYTLVIRNGYYYVQWWEYGGSQRVSLRTADPREAEIALAHFKAGLLSAPPPPSPTISEILDGYQHERIGKVFSNTIRDMCVPLKRHLGDLHWDMWSSQQNAEYWRVRRLEGVQGAPGKYRKHKKPLSDGTLIRELGVLRSAFKWAHHEKWISELPYVERPPAPLPRARWLTHEEADRLLDAAKQWHTRLFILIGLNTGARTGAILGLTWDRIHVAGQADGYIDFGAGRGKKRRVTVKINDGLRDTLIYAAEGATCKWVIAHGDKPIANIRHSFIETAKRARLKDVTPHTLRHTAVSWMVQENVPMHIISGYVGMSIKLIQTVYGHLSPTHYQQAIEALSRPRGLVSGSVTKEKKRAIS